MKLCRAYLLILLTIVITYSGSSARALNCSFIFASPGLIELPSSGGPAFVNVSVGPDLGCTYSISSSGPAIQFIGSPGPSGFSFTANANSGPFNLNGTITVSTGQASSFVSVVVDPPSAVGLGGLTTALDPVASTMEVDYVSGDGHVHQLSYNGSWSRSDLSALTGSSGASSTADITTAFNSIAGTMEVHYVGTDQHVHTLWFNGTWHHSDLTATTGALNAIAGSALTVLRNPLVNTMELEYIGTDQHVHLLFYDGNWHTQDLTTTTGAPNAESSSRLASEVNTVANTVEVHYTGTDHHVHTLWYSGAWHTSDLTAATGAPNAATGSPLTAIVDTITNTVEVEYVTTGQHVYQLWYNGLWHPADLTVLAGAPNAASNSRLATELNTLANTMEVHYIGTDQHVHTLWYNGSWHSADLTAMTGAVNAASGSPVTAIVDTIAHTVEVEYVGTDQHVHQFYYDGVWHSVDLTAITGG